MALDQITEEDLKYRFNKLKCCFATRAAELVDKQRAGKVCKDELCNLKLLGAYVEIIECYAVLPCECTTEWELDGSVYWNAATTWNYGDVVKVITRPNAAPGEFLYFRWQGINPLIPPTGVCSSPGGFQMPCVGGLNGIGPMAWSVCGNVKQAWQARGSLIFDATLIYGWGDIVQFMGGGPGLDQSGQGKFYISVADPNLVNTGFHENQHWVKLECHRKQEI